MCQLSLLPSRGVCGGNRDGINIAVLLEYDLLGAACLGDFGEDIESSRLVRRILDR